MSFFDALRDGSMRFALIAAVFVATLILGHVLGTVLRRILQRIARGSSVETDDIILEHCTRPLRIILTTGMLLVELRVLAGWATLDPQLTDGLRQLASIAMIVSATWLLVASVQVLEQMLLRRYDMQQEDNLEARRMITQVRLIKRIVIVIVLLIGAACLLMTFERVRQLGTSLLASAGIAGVILGIAAQRSLATIIAGLQIAFTQPIRIDDVVIVEGEWGKIEEISLTYVVVRIWDQRRLIVPITFFIEKPFQNWTRVSADILGSVFLYVDYTVPIEELRAELRRILEGSELWDRKVCALQLTDSTEKSVEVRALMSARDSSKAWDLRCLVREKLIEFVQTNYPDALPRERVQLRAREADA